MHYFTYSILFIKPTDPTVRKHTSHSGPHLIREVIQAPNRRRAEEWGAALATERGWLFLYVQRKGPDAEKEVSTYAPFT
jgi:hypothetical protein